MHVDYSNLKEQYQDMINYCKSLNVGDKIKFQQEKQRYKIIAKSDRFIICTKPFNPKKAFLYSIIDLQRIVRGAVNLIFGLVWDFDDTEELQECISELESGKVEVSHRNCILLDVEIPVLQKGEI